MSLDELQRIRQWNVAHQRDHPLEYHAFEVMLTLWVVGWVGWVPAFVFDALWAAPLLAVAMSAPALYVTLRLKAHRSRRLRCDWIHVRG